MNLNQVLRIPASFSPPVRTPYVIPEVELSISARRLHRTDILSCSDPFCVVSTKPLGTNEWVELLRTETVGNNHNPDFLKKAKLEYHFEERQELKFDLYDEDSLSRSLSDHDFLGFTVTTLGQIVSSGKLQLQLKKYNDFGQPEVIRSYLIVSAEELNNNNDEVVFKLRGSDLDRKDWFGKSDPLLEISKAMADGSFIMVHKTEYIKNTTNPNWEQFTITVKELCNSDYQRKIRFDCLDRNTFGEFNFIGYFETTLDEMAKAGTGGKFPLINPRKQKKPSYKNSGEIVMEYFEIRKIHSFIEFIQGGMQVHCTVAIDFTGSNGDPRQPDSLHYLYGGANKYEQAINAVVPIIEDYDSDKQFPVLGFGAKIPPDGQVSHEFYVTLTNSPFCSGTSGILSSYRECLTKVQLYGPTNFAPIIKHVIRFASNYRNGENYFILLMLTDGIISDMQETINEIVEASLFPMSIIIIGIGDADFSAMEILDADLIPLRSTTGEIPARDVVQFVPLNRFLQQGDAETANVRLAKEVLKEIPKQVTSYMRHFKIKPKPPVLNITDAPPDPGKL